MVRDACSSSTHRLGMRGSSGGDRQQTEVADGPM